MTTVTLAASLLDMIARRCAALRLTSTPAMAVPAEPPFDLQE